MRGKRGLVWGVLGVAWALGLAGCGRQAGPDPATVEAMNRGVALMGQYAYSDAVVAFEEVRRLAPDLVEGRLNLAIARFNRNAKDDLSAAESLLAEVLRVEPKNARALYLLAVLRQHVGKAEEAVPLLEQVVAQRPQDGAAWYVLALCRQRVGQPAEADFLRALEHRPYLYSAYYQLYQAAMRAGKGDEAAGYLERFKALRASPLGDSIELPQYHQMGDLALATPLARAPVPPLAKSTYRPGSARALPVKVPTSLVVGDRESCWALGLAAGDLDGNGLADLVVPRGVGSGVSVVLQRAGGGWADGTTQSGLGDRLEATQCAVGDLDNDGVPDLVLVGVDRLSLWRGRGEARFEEVTAAWLGGSEAPGVRAALLVDADHDGDLDLMVCGVARNWLWNNNGDATFTDLAEGAGVACVEGGSRRVLPGDLDGDRDLDLVVLREGGAVRLFRNELLGRYVEMPSLPADTQGGENGVLQDFDGDGLLDLVVLGGAPARLQFWRGDGRGQFEAGSGLTEAAAAAASRGVLGGFRAVDIDLDGDLDLVCFGGGTQWLLNDGTGRWFLPAGLGGEGPGKGWVVVEVLDVSGDLVPDLVVVEQGGEGGLHVVGGELTPPSTALAVSPTGVRSRDGRTRSPASGYGVVVTVRAGLREQRLLHAGVWGGAGQSWLPVVAGLGGAARADYVQLLWPDGVAQVEMAMAAGQTHSVSELQRKISSCPVLFAWDGSRFGFVTDFAGVGGLGYFVSPGVAAPPQVEEHVKIEPDQLRSRDGRYELRVTEPMEESAYVDRLELRAVDHPEGMRVYPDERLAISGPAPTHALLAVDEPWFPRKATGPSGEDCTDRVRRVDREYAYEPVLDRRYIGFCRPHTLELDFGDVLEGTGADAPLYLFIHGFIEYPYSQTVYAASQSRVGWEPIRVEALGLGGEWVEVVADGGVPGGMARTMAVRLPGGEALAAGRLRLTTNLEIYYDQIWVGVAGGAAGAGVRTVPLLGAELRYGGFAREHSPDGRLPWIFDYDLSDRTAPFHVLTGAYTRYGSVASLLGEYDDQYVIMGPGDELVLAFDGTGLPPLPAGWVRSFVLVSHAYCKDMDLYTATPRTLGPLPFRGMSVYPYGPEERYPGTEQHELYRATYNTRVVE